MGFFRKTSDLMHLQYPGGPCYKDALSAARDYLSVVRGGKRYAAETSRAKTDAFRAFNGWKGTVGHFGDLTRADKRRIRRIKSILDKAKRIEKRKSRA